MNPVIELIRLEANLEFGTFGVLRINKRVFCVTLEPPDLENQLNRSSIPAGQYFMKRTVSMSYGHTFEVCDVPGRAHILFHPGNLVSHTQGCILLARHYGKLAGNRAVLNSGRTFKAFMARMSSYDMAHLTIYEHY